MKKLMKIALLMLCTLTFSIGAFAARQGETTLRGTIVDTAGEPAGFATVFLSGANGAIICGNTADAEGNFELRAAQGDYTLTVSLVGYRDASQPVTLTNSLMILAPITLQEDTELLGEAVISAVMPKTRLTGEGLATSVRGSVLENAGTARDVLGKVPGLIKNRDGIEVINNPGAQYDATVRAVVRIRTIRRQGEGFGFDVTLSDQQSLQTKDINDPSANLNVNYRTGGVDIFAGGNYNSSTQRQISELTQETIGKANYRQVSHPSPHGWP